MAREQEPRGWITPEQVDQNMRQYLLDSEFGTPKYFAFHDAYHLSGLKEQWKREIGFVEKSNPDERISQESYLRITEGELAILNRQIASRRVDIKGYPAVYDRISLEFDRLLDACFDEIVRKNLPESDQAKVEMATKRWTALVSDWATLVAQKAE